MTVTIQPADVSGTLTAPASKSMMQRACVAALLAGGTTYIQNPGKSHDDLATLQLIKFLGADILHEEIVRVYSSGVKPVNNELNCGESGLGMRMITPVAALSSEKITLNGRGSLLNRPVHFFDTVLPALHVACRSNNGKLPVEIQGPLQAEDITVDGSLSSQFLTGLLMAFSVTGGGKTIRVTDLKSRPYIDLTLQVMKEFGLPLPENRNYEYFIFPKISIENKAEEKRTFFIEGDWSGGAMLLALAAIAGKITVEGLFNTSKQGDKLFVDALLDAGAHVEVSSDKVTVEKRKLTAFTFNASDSPDLFPPLVALATFAEGETTIRGLKRLEHKESNRGLTLKKEFEKFGIEIQLDNDEMRVISDGTPVIRNPEFDSHGDHRIAMATAIAAVGCDEEVLIHGADAVNKSYPDFWNHLKLLGVDVSLREE